MSEPHPPTKQPSTAVKLVKLGGKHRGITTITPAGIEALEALAARGVSQASAATLLGCCRDTLRKCFEVQPETREAWDRGLAKLEDELTAKWLEMARAGNVACVIFGLKCKAGWRETGPVSGQAESPTRVVINLPGPQASAEYRAQFVDAQGHEVQRGT